MDPILVSDGAERLTQDAATVRTEFDRLTKILSTGLDRGRLLVVLSAAGRADQHLTRTMPRLLDQIAAAGLEADFLLGCNAGFEPRGVLQALSARPGVELIYGRCIKTGSDPAPVHTEDGARLFLDRPNRAGDRVYVVRQAATAFARGKIRMLSDLFGWVTDSIERGWAAPRYLLACDAESEFTGVEPMLNRHAEDRTLALLVNRLEADDALQVVGARNRNTAFRTGDGGVLEPDFDQPVPGIQRAMNLLHMRAKGFLGLVGSGILGRTPAMVAAYATLCRLYPNTRIDDLQIGVLLQAAGLQVGVEPGVAALNFCPRADQTEAGNLQSDRWIGGIKDLEALYGRDVVAPIASTSILSIVRHANRLCHRDAWSASGLAAKATVLWLGIKLLFVLGHFLRTYRKAIVQRGDDPTAIAYWSAG